MKKSILFMIIIIVVVAIIGVLTYFILESNDGDEGNNNIVKTVGEIKGYNITLKENASDAYKSEFEILRKNLESANINTDEYAESVAKMFLMDLYTINNKKNKYDVGGLDFVMPESKDNYILNVTNTLYSFVEDNTRGKRKQSLPEVTSVVVDKVERREFVIESTKTTYDAYYFNMSLKYRYDLGYDQTAEVIVINKDNFMYVVEKN